jgi:hypothetical protein
MKEALKKIVGLFLNSAEKKTIPKKQYFNQSDLFIFISSCVGVYVRQNNTPKHHTFCWEIISTELILLIKTNKE